MAKKIFGLSGKDTKRLEQMLRWFEKSSHNPVPPPRTRRPLPLPPKMTPKFWVSYNYVSTDADGAANDYGGYYSCYEITFDATLFNRGESIPWTQSETTVVVFNLQEAGTTMSAGIPCNIKSQLFYGWSIMDDEGNFINVGFPVVPSVLFAYVASDQTGMNGSFYRCQLFAYQQAYWNTTPTGPSMGATAAEIEVVNLWEYNNNQRLLQTGDFMICFPHLPYLCFKTDSGQGMKWVGIPICCGKNSIEITGARDEPEGALKDLLTTLANARFIKDSTTAS